MYSKIIIAGRLGKEPALQYTPKGTASTKFSVAVNTGSGDNERTDWFNVATWGNTAEACNQYLSKGSLVLVEGEMRNNKWTDDEGNNRDWWEINAFRVKFLDKKGEATEPVDETDIPF